MMVGGGIKRGRVFDKDSGGVERPIWFIWAPAATQNCPG